MNRVFSAAALASCLAAATPALAAPVMTLTPATNHVEVGGMVRVDAVLSGLEPDIVSAYDLTLVYDSSVLHWASISFVSGLGHSTGVATRLVEGALGLAETSRDTDATLAALEGDTLFLFSFSFLGMADGLTWVGFGDAGTGFARTMTGALGLPLEVKFADACVAVGTASCDGVTEVPEPASGALAGLALLSAAGVRRGRRALRCGSDARKEGLSTVVEPRGIVIDVQNAQPGREPA